MEYIRYSVHDTSRRENWDWYGKYDGPHLLGECRAVMQWKERNGTDGSGGSVRLDANNSGSVNGAEWASPRTRSSWDCAETDIDPGVVTLGYMDRDDLMDRITLWGVGPSIT